MEYPRGAVNAERTLAVLALAAALATAWAQSGAPLSARLRDGRPWLAWVAAPEGGGTVHLAIYRPWRRRLALLHVPGEAAIEPAEARLRSLSAEPLPPIPARIAVAIAPDGATDEPSIEAALALKARGRSPRAWADLARDAWRGLRSGDRAALEPLLFALELRRVRLGEIQPARLPDDAQAAALLGALLSTQAPADGSRPVTAEVLNGTGAPGLASRAAKMLRFKGVDVLTLGSVPARARTLVYDRTGDFERAERVLAALGCPSARAATRVDAARVVDASVLLGPDCEQALGPDDARRR